MYQYLNVHTSHIMSISREVGKKMNYITYYDNGEAQYIKGNYYEALHLFEKSLALKETNDCLNYIACCHLELGDFDVAANIFRKLIKACPCWERPIFNLGRVLIELENYKDALACFENAVELNPISEDAYYYLGVFYYKVKDYQKTKECYEKSLSINYEQPETHLSLGKCYYHLDMNEKALHEFDIAYNSDNNCIDAVYNKGVVLIAMEDYQEALKNLFVINKSEPDDVEVMMKIAHCYYKLKSYTDANYWVTKILTIESDHSLANKLLKRLKDISVL